MMEVAVSDSMYVGDYSGSTVYDYNETSNVQNSSTASYIALYISIALCIIAGIVLGIIFGKKAANK